MSDAKKNLLLFFDRPTEPCFMQKGKDKAIFQLPDHYFPDKYKAVSSSLGNRFGEESGRTIPVRNIALPSLDLPMQLPYNEQFSLFVPKHRQMARKLVDIFMGMRDVDDLMSVCSFCQLRINPYMFNYCLSVAILHRPDTKGLSIPTIADSFPDKFMDPKIFRKAREVATTVPQGSRIPITIPQNYTASDQDPEQRIAYYREDIGVNLHHWHWHLVYPFDAADKSLVNKDRRGELFYYMHQQIIARYNCERLCNNLAFVVPFDNFQAPIPEAYFSKLDSQVASRSWAPRFENTVIKDLDRPVDQIKIEVSTLEVWRDRFISAIQSNSIRLPNGREVPLTEETGIDVLGNIMEASTLSPNRGYYGDLHNMGHVIISYAHDPDHRHLEQFGVMGDPATDFRDPIFFRWHAFVDNMFFLYKNRLPPYTVDQLDFPGIRVTGISITDAAATDSLRTQWEQSTVDLARGLDFTPRGSILARFTHLQHEDFEYVIEVANNSNKSVMGMVRIFMGVVKNDSGQVMPIDEQSRHMIEMDKFQIPLSPGNNVIRRRSVDSSVTIPFERTFTNQADRRGEPGTAESAEFDFCGCGWPQHLLIPKGTPDGFPMDLFVMVTDWSKDGIEQNLVGSCNDAASYCGLRDRLYPDRRAMGYPFDRQARQGVSSMRDFMTPNMSVKPIRITFTDATRVRGQTK